METEKKEYKLSGMTCAACAMTIEMVVKELPTVKEATVNLATEKLTVFPKEGFTSEQVLEAVKEAGYQAAEKGEQKPSDYAKQVAEKKENVRHMARRIWFAVGVTIPLLTSPGFLRLQSSSDNFCFGTTAPDFTSYWDRTRLLYTWFSEPSKTASQYG